MKNVKTRDLQDFNKICKIEQLDLQEFSMLG
jgi:hypothetical protein